MTTAIKTPVIVYAESTPNPAAMKFVVNKPLIENSIPLEYLTAADAKGSPLATELFKFPFVKSVFISVNYITVVKIEAIQWDDIILELREFVREFLSSGKAAVTSIVTTKGTDEDKNKLKEDIQSNDHTTPQGDIEVKIINTLEQYIRPAVEQDGGMIVFRSFKDGIVNLSMKGACSGCPSSTVTLKAGIETLLKKFIPEVKEVVSE